MGEQAGRLPTDPEIEREGRETFYQGTPESVRSTMRLLSKTVDGTQTTLGSRADVGIIAPIPIVSIVNGVLPTFRTTETQKLQPHDYRIRYIQAADRQNQAVSFLLIN